MKKTAIIIAVATLLLVPITFTFATSNEVAQYVPLPADTTATVETTNAVAAPATTTPEGGSFLANNSTTVAVAAIIIIFMFLLVLV